MTDERIEQDAIELAEDFTDWMWPSWPMMGAFTATKKLASMSNKRLRAAERLAKIEVLEEVRRMFDNLDSINPVDYSDSFAVIDSMLSDLKGEQ